MTIRKSYLWGVVLFVSIAMIASFSVVGCEKATTSAETATATIEAETEEATGETTADATPAAEKPFAGIEISVGTWQDPWQNVIIEMLPDFEEKTGIKVNWEQIPFPESFDKLILDLTSHSAQYDVLSVCDVWVADMSPYIVPLDNYINRDKEEVKLEDVFKSGQESMYYEEKIPTFPLACYHEILFYRTDLFEEEGVNPPKTMDETLELAKLFTNNPKYPDLYGTALLSGRAASGYTWDGLAVGSYYGDPIFDKDYKVKVNTKPWVDALSTLVELNKYSPPGSLDYLWEQQAEAFRQGKVAFYWQWDLNAQTLNDPTKSKVVDKWATALEPSIDGKGTSVDAMWGLGINNDSKKQDAAWEFIKWMTSFEVLKPATAGGAPPARISVITDSEISENAPWLVTVKDATEAAKMYRPKTRGWNQIIDELAIEYQAALSGSKSIEQAVNDAQEALVKIAIDNNYPQD